MSCAISADLYRSAKRSSNFPASWSDDDIRRELARYEKFLILAQRHPGQPLAPTKNIDEMWHLHMTHPRAYRDDCMRLFGDILDHDGGFGADPAELTELQRTFARTAELWQQEFGEPYVKPNEDPRATNCWHDCQSRCWHACKSESPVMEIEEAA
jgi:hypothetical protein